MRTVISLILLTCIGCAHPISKGLRESLDPGVSQARLFEDPDAYSGKKVMLGGTIVQTRNYPDTTEIEVVQKGIDAFGYLESGDATMGRFIFRQPGYLESEVYAKDREIVGAGKVVGSKLGKVGDREYRYPVIQAEEVQLSEPYPRYPYYSDPFFYDPFYPYHPRYYPYYPYYRRHPYFW